MTATKVVIQLADRSCISPKGVLENVIVKVHDFMYPADFHVIKMSENETVESSGVLLGRPFLRTAKTIIDVFDFDCFSGLFPSFSYVNLSVSN